MARHPQWIIDTEQRTHPAISIDLKFRHLAEKLAFLQHRTLIDKWTTCRLFVHVACPLLSVSELAMMRQMTPTRPAYLLS